MSLYLGLDTSNYTTSAAVYDDRTNRILQNKQLLPVKKGERGIRQSDAVFHHNQQLPRVLGELLEDVSSMALPAYGSALKDALAAVGVSGMPRRIPGSYMPCFSVGVTNAVSIASTVGIPLGVFSHQEGHIAAALYSADRMDLIGQEFLAFHVSGGTTESLLVRPGRENPLEAELVGTSTDLKAGQAIDRVGVLLGLQFPCGNALEQLATMSRQDYHPKASLQGLNCSLSGVENQCQKMIADGAPEYDVALYCLRAVEAALQGMAKALTEKYPGLPIVFSGGVMSNGLIRKDFEAQFDCCFAEPAFSADNAAGVAVLSALKYKGL